MTEGILLSTAASMCALLFAFFGIEAARIAVMTYLLGTFRAATIALDRRVLGAAILAALVTGVFSSLVPAWQASRVSVLSLLKDASPTITTSGRSWRSRLLAGEVACVSVLLVVSWLFVTSLIRVIGIDLGVDPSHLLAVSSNRAFTGTVGDVRRRLESVPGIMGVAVARGASLPLIGRAFGGAWTTTSAEARGCGTRPGGDGPSVSRHAELFRRGGNPFPSGIDVAGDHTRCDRSSTNGQPRSCSSMRIRSVIK